MKFREQLKLVAAGLLLLLISSACQATPSGPAAAPTASPTAAAGGQGQSEAESTLARAKREGRIRVGYPGEKPFAYQEEDGTLNGAAIQVAREIFGRMGITELEGVRTEFADLIPDLRAGRFDVITAGMYILPARCEQILFADPEAIILDALIVPAGNPYDLHSYADIAAKPNITVGTGNGYIENEYMAEVGVSPDQIVNRPDDVTGFAALQAGEIDAWTATRPTLLQLLADDGSGDFEVADPFETPVVGGQPVVNYTGLGFRLEDLELRQEYNQHLQELKDEGKLLDLIGQFQGLDENALPGDVKAEDICPEAYADIP